MTKSLVIKYGRLNGWATRRPPSYFGCGVSGKDAGQESIIKRSPLQRSAQVWGKRSLSLGQGRAGHISDRLVTSHIATRRAVSPIGLSSGSWGFLPDLSYIVLHCAGYVDMSKSDCEQRAEEWLKDGGFANALGRDLKCVRYKPN